MSAAKEWSTIIPWRLQWRTRRVNREVAVWFRRPNSVETRHGFLSASRRGFSPILGYLYFVTYNIEQDYLNPTGLRLEFTSAYFTPE